MSVYRSSSWSTTASHRYSRARSWELTVTGLEHSVRPGQTLQVYGIARPDGTIRAVNSVVVPASNYLYMYAVSALAGVWVLWRLVRGWTLDRATLTIHRRSTPLRRSDVRSAPSEEEIDA